MSLMRFAAATLSGAMLVVGGGVFAQNFPSRPIRIVTAPPGGSADLVARLVAQELMSGAGWQVVVENRASGLVGEVVSKSSPDGFTLALAGGNLWLTPFLQAKVSYDPVRDFAPVAILTSAPNILVVHPSLPVKSVKELIGVAKARPGALNYAVSGWGDSAHLSAELFKAMAAIDIVRIDYRGSGPALLDLISGHVHLAFAGAAGVAPHVKSGKLRALAVTSAKPSALVPGVPTVGASGLTGYETASTLAVFAPVKTPEAIISRLNQEIVKAVNVPAVRERFLYSGVEPVGGSATELAMTMKSDMEKMGKVIADLGIRTE